MKSKVNPSSLPLYLYLFTCLLFFSCDPATAPLNEEQGKPSKTLLKDYVMAPDSTYRYELAHSVFGDTYDFHVLKLYSQYWLTSEETDQTEWWHWVSLVVPKDTPFETGMMWIGGGSTNSKMPERPDPLILAASTATNSIVAQVHNVPFQPITFTHDTVGERYEDAIIAYGWRKFMEGGAKDEDAVWLARLPMTKAVKLAMDAVTEVVYKDYNKNLKNFVVGGASKRGWTTWTTAAVDDRVVAIIPVVIDMLNLVPSFQHHWKNYGFWAPAVGDYVREGVMDQLGTPEFDRLLEITEPYSYIDEYAMPKLIINAAGDQFFQPDSWKFYWDKLPGEKHLQYVPNYGHDVGDSDALPNLISFYAAVLNGSPRPDYSWKIEDDQILLETDVQNRPSSIKLWTAHNPDTRDFRVDVFGTNWKAEEVPLNDNGKYRIHMESPSKGYKGYFLEITYAGKTPLKFTTGVDVLPRAYPFSDFKPEQKTETVN